MENCVVLEGVADDVSDDDLAEEVGKLIGRVARLQRVPGREGALLLQFGLENMARLAVGSLHKKLPSTCWRSAEESPKCGEESGVAAPRIRCPNKAEYDVLTKAWLEAKHRERNQRFCRNGGQGTAPDNTEYVFDFSADRGTRGETVEAFQIKLSVSLDGCGTGSALWSCGLLLAECIWQRLIPLCGKRVLELGCGCAAVPSILAARVGADRVVATDLLSELVACAKSNASPHGVEVEKLDWAEFQRWKSVSDTEFKSIPDAQRADVVLWSDAVYTDYGGYLLAHAVHGNLRIGGSVIAVIPAEDRPGMETLEETMVAAGYIRTCDQRVPSEVFERADQRFGLSSGLVGTAKSPISDSRLVTWEAEDLYD